MGHFRRTNNNFNEKHSSEVSPVAERGWVSEIQVIELGIEPARREGDGCDEP